MLRDIIYHFENHIGTCTVVRAVIKDSNKRPHDCREAHTLYLSQEWRPYLLPVDGPWGLVITHRHCRYDDNGIILP